MELQDLIHEIDKGEYVFDIDETLLVRDHNGDWSLTKEGELLKKLPLSMVYVYTNGNNEGILQDLIGIPVARKEPENRYIAIYGDGYEFADAFEIAQNAFADAVKQGHKFPAPSASLPKDPRLVGAKVIVDDLALTYMAYGANAMSPQEFAALLESLL